jgi:hypothetical protein
MFSDDQLRRKDIDTLRRWLLHKLGGYIIAVKDMPAGQRLYRAVRSPQPPEKISRISYPPADITSLGRLNRPGQSKFYCSAGGPPVFYELHARQGDLIGFSEWETTEPLWVHNLGFHPRALMRIGAQSGTIDMRHRVTHAIPDETKVNEKLRYQISKAFTADVPKGKEYRYNQTIAINESLSDVVYVGGNFPGAPKNPKIAGTVYPAMKMRGDADNVALLPEFVDSSLRLVSVRYVKVEEANETSSFYKLLTLGIAETFSGDTINWSNALGSEDDRRTLVTFENDHWVMRDGHGRIYYTV